MKAYFRSHVGLVREQNEDTVLTDEQNGLYILADGMGGHQAGEVASALAADTLLERLKDAEPAQGTLHAAIAAANAAVYEQQLNNADQAGMGTTLTVLWDAGDHVLLGHVGDSRAYVYMQGRLRQVSKDHSMVGEMLRAGMLTEEQARSHPYRNVITRAVGTD
ncbi:MAG: serine/threonine-protein phosphatase, partial [Clostridia bacterium]|nr:serine/threonine-protein phosphatase [Clostridia bacterium]